MYGNNLSKRDALMIGALMTSLLLTAEPAAAQQDVPIAPEAMDAAVEPSADLDITLQVVEDAGSAEDLLNTIELPEEVREVAEQRLAAALAAIKAARDLQADGNAEQEALMEDMAERRAELVASAQASALAANEQAQQAVESAREAVEEALKNGLTNAEMQGMIEQMIQDIFGALPDEARGGMGDMGDVSGLLESLRGDATAGAEAGSGG